MSHAITILDLIKAFAILCGMVMMATGILANFAAGMASAPSQNDGKKGCLSFFIGLFVVAAVIFSYS